MLRPRIAVATGRIVVNNEIVVVIGNMQDYSICKCMKEETWRVYIIYGCRRDSRIAVQIELSQDKGKLQEKWNKGSLMLNQKTGRHTANNSLPVRHQTQPGWAVLKKTFRLPILLFPGGSFIKPPPGPLQNF
jgi:hypothetical protein